MNKLMGYSRPVPRGFLAVVVMLLAAFVACAQTEKPTAAKKAAPIARPKLVVMIVVDQMRADYVDKFRSQWTGGLKRLLDQGAWFREAAYPYASTQTCPGHATVSTGALPASHGMVANAWWDRDAQKMVTCTSDDNVKNVAYAGATTKGGDSAVRMRLPAFAEELKFQQGGTVAVATFSLKARAAITLAGHMQPGPEARETVLWFDPSTGCWVTSDYYGTSAFAEEYIKQHPVKEDYGKTWSPSLPQTAYFYEKEATGAATVAGWNRTFPHPLRGKGGTDAPDETFYHQWETSPFADTYLTQMAEAAVTALELWNTGETDYLGVSYSSVDYVGHTFGPRSWEIQDILVRLDKDLGELFTHLDQKVGRGKYVVALTGDHGVAPIPADMQKTGFDANVLNLAELKERVETALEPFNYPKPAIARTSGNEVYFSQGVYDRLRREPPAMKAILDAALATPGVAAVFRAEELHHEVKTVSHMRTAVELSYFAERSGDLYVLQQPYWLTATSAEGAKHNSGTGHGTPYYYDQRVPVLFMGFGMQPGQYFGDVTPADIAPTFAALTGVTLATHDGRVLSEALQKQGTKQ
jgi:predicted AlkP superfamily pyrophosphatase or phosphodiesterase